MNSRPHTMLTDPYISLETSQGLQQPELEFRNHSDGALAYRPQPFV